MDQIGETLFNAPFIVLGVVLLAGVIALGFGVLRDNPPARKIGAAVLAVGVVWGALSHFVQTPTEAAVERSEGLADAFEAEDWNEFGRLLDPETRFFNRLKGQQIAAAARLTHDATGAGVVRILSTKPERDGDALSVTMRVMSEHANAPTRQVVTLYRFDYHKRAGEWKLEAIEPLATEQFDAPAYLKFLVMPPAVRGDPA